MNDGNHLGKVVGFGFGFTKDGKEQVAVDFHLPETQETITWYGYFTDKSAPITFKALRTLGWTGDDLSDLSAIQDAEAMLAIKHEEYNGRVTPKVNWVNPVNGPSLQNQMGPDALKAFAARMKPQVRAHDASEGKPKMNGKPPAQKAPAAKPRQGVLSPEPPPHTGADDLDVPF